MPLEEQGVLGEFPYAIWLHDELEVYNGYLGVPPSHPWYGKDKEEINVEVHGGLTFSDASHYGNRFELDYQIKKISEIEAEPFSMSESFIKWRRGILQQEAEMDGSPKEYPYQTELDIWWLGFDCGHGWDVIPGIDKALRASGMKPVSESMPGVTFKDRDFVYHELEGMARQAAEVLQNARKEE